MNLLEEKIKKIDVFLASKSPRRHELLKNIIPQFSIVNKDIKEEYPKNLPTDEIAKYLAELKAKAFINDSTGNNLFLTADTIVVFQNKVLGKPSNEEEAFNMLSELSGETHVVYTGVTLLFNKKLISFQDATKVTFYPLKKEEINYYINHHQPFDKAGSYGIQEWMGYVGIKKMEGDFFNVMGLPLHKTYREIDKLLT
mgnify:CR=1 FL=1